MHGGVHHVSHVIALLMTRRRQEIVARQNDPGHRSSTAHQIVLLRLVAAADSGSLRDERRRDTLHVKVEVLIRVHVRGGRIRLRVLVRSLLSVHTAQLALPYPVHAEITLVQLSLERVRYNLGGRASDGSLRGDSCTFGLDLLL